MRLHATGLWKDPDFVKLWWGRTISSVGSGITGIALPLTAVLTLSATPAQVSILSALSGAAVLLFGLIAGLVVDRFRRRTILIATDLGRALLVVSLPLAALVGILRIEQLYVVAALVEILGVFFNVANVAYLPGLVKSHKLVEANSRLGISDAIAEIGGPGLAGVLVQLLSAPLAMVVDAFSFLSSAFCILRIQASEPVIANEEVVENIWQESIMGIRTILDDPVLRSLALGVGLFNCAGMFIGTFYPLYIVRELGITPIVLGFLIGSGGVSALFGAWISERVIHWMGLGRATAWGLFLYGVLGLLTPLAQGPISIVMSMLFISQLMGDVTASIHLIADLSLRQTLIPSHLLGRANAGFQMLAQGAGPFGALLAGIVALHFGVRFTILAGALGVVAAGLWLLLSPVRTAGE